MLWSFFLNVLVWNWSIRSWYLRFIVSLTQLQLFLWLKHKKIISENRTFKGFNFTLNSSNESCTFLNELQKSSWRSLSPILSLNSELESSIEIRNNLDAIGVKKAERLIKSSTFWRPRRFPKWNKISKMKCRVCTSQFE